MNPEILRKGNQLTKQKDAITRQINALYTSPGHGYRELHIVLEDEIPLDDIFLLRDFVAGYLQHRLDEIQQELNDL